jgi:hypothetical protein
MDVVPQRETPAKKKFGFGVFLKNASVYESLIAGVLFFLSVA